MINNYTSEHQNPVYGYFGGKARLARRILQLLPEHRVYVECFAGSLAVLLNKHRSEQEIVCDLDPDLIHYYYFLVNHTEDLIQRIKTVPYDRTVWVRAYRDSKARVGDDLERAANWVVRWGQAWGGCGWSWSGAVDGSASIRKAQIWAHLDERLRRVADRLRGVTILHANAFDVLRQYDGSDTGAYVDPPYYHATRVSKSVYSVEMGSFEHLHFLRLLNSLSMNIVLSGYKCHLYDTELAGWDRYTIDVVASSSANNIKKPRRTEVLWVRDRTLFT